MSITRQDVEDGAAWARRALRKPEPNAAERKLSSAERIAAYLAQSREAEAKATQTRSAVEATRRDLHTPGSAFEVGAERFAADGSRWKRTG
jgi:hypothetical protein